MIDISNKKMIPCSQVPHWCKEHLGLKFNRSTIFRWYTRGSKGGKLETIRAGGRRYTSEEALLRFFNRTPSGQAQKRSRSKRELEAEAFLDSEGL